MKMLKSFSVSFYLFLVRGPRLRSISTIFKGEERKQKECERERKRETEREIERERERERQ